MSWLFSKKEVMSDVRSEIHLVRRNFVSNGQSARALKNHIHACSRELFPDKTSILDVWLCSEYVCDVSLTFEKASLYSKLSKTYGRFASQLKLEKWINNTYLSAPY